MTMLSHKQLLLLAYGAASESPHPSTQVGAMLYYPRAFGGVPYPETMGNNHIPERLRVRDVGVWGDRESRTIYVEHAERAAIYSAARNGICTDRLGMVATWAACEDCARAIISAGITEVLTDARSLMRTPPEWIGTVSAGQKMLEDAGVNVILYESVFVLGEIRHGGKSFIP